MSGAKSGQISDALLRILGLYGKDIVTVYLCKVTAVNETARTCDAQTIHGDAEISLPEVQLSAAPNDGMILIPAINSMVMVAITTQQKAFVMMFSDLQKATITIAKTVFTMDATGITLNDGSYGGMVKVTDLVSRMNAIENDINAIKTVFASWIPVPNDGGAALKAGAAAWYGAALTLTTEPMIENNEVKHGHL